MKPIIRVENLSKEYSIGVFRGGHRTLRDSLSGLIRSFGKRERTKSELIWALKDVSFEIHPGEVVGVIGRNGAGKSTLLKILSRITEPTSGTADLFGSVASLLEVGTGFHPELTGRENIFLNGAMLGMRKSEIVRKFDEIVAFAEIEKFLDTPVKHYSSGMYVRLAFAVAAHLEPDVLIIDEVLAVGDMSFQNKCLGKMGEVARRGRTVLFVSHNLAAIRGLCSRALRLKNGRLDADADVDSIIGSYLAEDQTANGLVIWEKNDAPRSEDLVFRRAYILNDREEIASLVDHRRPFHIVIEYDVLKPIRELAIGFFVRNAEGIAITGSNDPEGWNSRVRGVGQYVSRCTFPGHCLNSGNYSIFFAGAKAPFYENLVTTPYCITFSVEDVVGHGIYAQRLPGVVRPKLEWSVSLREMEVTVDHSVNAVSLTNSRAEQ